MRELIRLFFLMQRLYPFMLTPERVQRAQERRLRHLLKHAALHSPFYRRRFEGIDLEKCALSDLPTLSKAQMMGNFDELVTDPSIKLAHVAAFVENPENLGKLFLGKYGVSHSSGSQGQPAIVVQDGDTLVLPFAVQFARGAPLSRKFLPHFGRFFRPARMALLLVRPGFYPSAATFAYRPKVLNRFLKILHLTASDAKSKNNALLESFGPQYITGYASALEALAREEREGRLQLKRKGTLKQITNVAEPLSDQARTAISEAFGVTVTDEYAMCECLVLSSGCLAGRGSHINADFAILEVVDRDNRPVPPGVEGNKVLLTNLYNTVQPIIRYEIDDLVTMSTAPCACGSILPKIERVSGRDKDTLWILDHGRPRALPYYVLLMGMHYEIDVAEHQIEQVGLNHFVIRAAPLPGRRVTAESIRRRVEQSLREEGITQPIRLDIEIVSEVPQGPSGKAARIKNAFGLPDERLAQELGDARGSDRAGSSLA